MSTPADPVRAIADLGLDDPARYTRYTGDELLRRAPHEVDEHATTEQYRHYADRSCDLTMRGGTTSGVIYPLAACSLAEHYVFRSIGGASAGAIAAAATAAAEYGRFAPQPESVPDPRVRPGFAGLAGIVRWLTAGSGENRWRLARLFQPDTALHRVFRVLIALMQRREITGRGRVPALAVATVSMVSVPARIALFLLVTGWLVMPLAHQRVLPVQSWAGVALPLAIPLAVLALLATAATLRLAAPRLGRATLALLLPLPVSVVVLGMAAASGTGTVPVAAWLVAGAAHVMCWLVTGFAALAAFTVVYLQFLAPLASDAARHRYGIVPGAVPYVPNIVDRLAGVPSSRQVPPLVTWLTDRIDDLAGLGPAGPHGDRALTFGDLWLGPDRTAGDDTLTELSRTPAKRVINLELMSTDLSSGRPRRVPFDADGGRTEEWQFCPRCVEGLLPDRVVRQMRADDATSAACRHHPDTALHPLPRPWNLPVIVGVRMSLSMPGVICAFPLALGGRTHWFTDGGITSNFPIHFFDSLLPRWPTFGLNLDATDGEVDGHEEVSLPEQDDSPHTEPWASTGKPITGFAWRILDTLLSWRDTMQAALPGFRGRIATVRQGPDEGGANLLMPPETVARLALRGYRAGETLKHRYTTEALGDEPAGQTRTDRYRWIRLRLAMREYRDLSSRVRYRWPLYRDGMTGYAIPEGLAGWFTRETGEWADGGEQSGWPRPDPDATRIDSTLHRLGMLAESELAEPFDGTAPTDPVLRLNAPE